MTTASGPAHQPDSQATGPGSRPIAPGDPSIGIGAGGGASGREVPAPAATGWRSTEQPGDPASVCHGCGCAITADTTEWRLAPDDVTRYPLCRPCAIGGWRGAWWRLRRWQRWLLAGFLGLTIALAAVLIMRRLTSRDTLMDEKLRLAQALFRDQQYRSAVAAFTAALELDPDNPEACLALGGIHLEVYGDPLTAAHWYDRLLARHPHHLAGRIGRVRAAIALGSDSVALAHLDTFFASSTPTLDALYLKATLLLRQDRPIEAGQLFTALTVLAPDNPAGWLLLAELRQSQAGTDFEVESLLDRAERIAPDNPAVRYQRGLYLRRRGFDLRAIDQFREAVRLAPDDQEFRLALAATLAAVGRHPDAIDELQLLLREHPGAIDPFVMLVMTLEQSGRREEAAAEIAAARERYRDHPLLLFLDGWMAVQRRDEATARAHLERLLAIPEAHAWHEAAVTMLVTLYYSNGEIGSAARLLAREAQRQPQNLAVRVQLAGIYLQQGAATDAVRIGRELLANREAMPWSGNLAALLEAAAVGSGPMALFAGEQGTNLYRHLSRANLARSRNDWAAAYEAFAAVATLGRQLPALHYLRGHAASQLGRHAEARAAYEAAVAADPEFIVARNNLAFLLADHFGETDRARSLLTTLPDESRAHPVIADTLAWIDVLSGNSARALPVLIELTRAFPAEGELWFHRAAAEAALGQRGDARANLVQALQLAPQLASHPQFLNLRLQLEQ